MEVQSKQASCNPTPHSKTCKPCIVILANHCKYECYWVWCFAVRPHGIPLPLSLVIQQLLLSRATYSKYRDIPLRQVGRSTLPKDTTSKHTPNSLTAQPSDPPQYSTVQYSPVLWSTVLKRHTGTERQTESRTGLLIAPPYQIGHGCILTVCVRMTLRLRSCRQIIRQLQLLPLKAIFPSALNLSAKQGALKVLPPTQLVRWRERERERERVLSNVWRGEGLK